MCVEIHTRFRRCRHTRFLRYEYCEDVHNDSHARQCPNYQLRFRDNQENYNCFECLHERAPPRQSATTPLRQGSSRSGGSSRVGCFLRWILSCA
ncbi:hypothetical protein PMIN01_02161 [Paraphaeosphaeria minitans]|uniref:Uncharacterized protein n=1 Tax=Paraphaeosphaeria minitans TaxID=565426 RepID=A0A9P6GPL1_9PLEO|nr:hypothetical protein PMIN01_02161 [Paraphaeosphaeria minitans]